MSIMRCDRHGPWDSDNWETCPRCESDIIYLEHRVEEQTALLEEARNQLEKALDNIAALKPGAGQA